MLINVPDEVLNKILATAIVTEDRMGRCPARQASLAIADDVTEAIAQDLNLALRMLRQDPAYHEHLKQVLQTAIDEAITKKAGALVSSMKQADIMFAIKGQ
jgi:hypothetical protein